VENKRSNNRYVPKALINRPMSTAWQSCLLTAALVLFAIEPSQVVHASGLSASAQQAPPSLQEQLEAQYPLAKMTAQGGCTITNPETELSLQKNGLGALPAKAYGTACATHYKDGTFKQAGFKCKYWLSMTKQNLVTLEKGDKLYPVKIEVGKDELKIGIGYCSGDSGQAAAYKAEVVFDFPKDFLTTAPVTQVEDRIAEVLSAEPSAEQQQAQSGPGPAQSSGDRPQAADNQPAASACNVQIDQTIDQVIDACGQPANKFKGAGTKQIFIYNQPKLKIVFKDGKVADID